MSTKHWLATYGDRIPTDIEPYANRSVAEMLEGAMKRYADKPAFRCFGQTLTYADTDRLSRALAAYLQQKLGVRKGDRIAVMLPNIPAFPLALMGIVRAGAAQVNVNPLYTPRELEHQLNDAGVEIIVVFSGASTTLAEIVGQTSVKHVISVALSDGTDAAIASPAVDARLTGVVSFAAALAEGANLRFTPMPVTGEDLLFLQYTGGTTGLSKGAALSHGNLVANAEQFRAFMPDVLRPGEEVVVTALPLYHIFALMVNFISYFSIGAENWLVTNPKDMDGFIDILREARPTIFTGVNTLFAGLLMQPRIKEVDFSNLRAAIGGGAAVLPITSERWKAVVSGFNVYPNEVEKVAASCTGVAECACIGVPDDKTGEAVRLFVVKAPGELLTEEVVIAHCRREMTTYKVPKQVRFLDALPKSSVGKILRKDLRTVQ